MAGELARPTLTAPKGSGRKRGPDLSVLVETTTVGLFGLVAVGTGHEHWLKERVDVQAITGPLNAWIDQLPAKTLKKMEKSLAPCLLVVGLATVLVPDTLLEMRLRNDEKRLRQAVSGPRPGPAPVGPVHHAPASSPGYPDAGASGGSRPAGGWHSGIPADAALSAGWDV